jgi:oligoendopeptidase F
MTQQTLPKRSEVNPEFTWDASSIFATHSDWDVALTAFKTDISMLSSFQGRLGDSGAVLLEFLTLLDGLRARLRKLSVYAGLFRSVDAEDNAANIMAGQVSSVAASFASLMAFGQPELLALGQAKLEQLIAQEPKLEVYKHSFEILEKSRSHVRSGEVEMLLGAVSEPFSQAAQTHGVMVNADLKFNPAIDSSGTGFEVAQSTLRNLIASPDRTLRVAAWESYSDGHLAFKNTMASAFSAGIKQDVFRAKARNYTSSLDAALTPEHIPLEVFHNLVSTFKTYIPMWHKYWDLRRKWLKLEKLSEADIFAPLSSNPPVVPYAQSCEWVLEGMKPLGQEYHDIMKRGLLEQRWVDVYPNKGKRLGAFSTGGQGMHPFIFMSYHDSLFELSTLAHELGHSMHSYFTWQNQPPIYANYTLFVAEVASNFNQALVRDHLFKTNSDPEFQIALLEEAFANFHRYFFVMPTLARFELEVHERVERGETLTADALIELCADLFKEGYGDAVEFDRERIGSTWMKFSSHLYSNFYVYQYATGIAGAHALTKGIIDGKPKASENYLKFLKAGSSVYPLEALKMAGVDLSKPDAVIETFEVLTTYVDRLEKLLETRS